MDPPPFVLKVRHKKAVDRNPRLPKKRKTRGQTRICGLPTDRKQYHLTTGQAAWDSCSRHNTDSSAWSGSAPCLDAFLSKSSARSARSASVASGRSHTLPFWGLLPVSLRPCQAEKTVQPLAHEGFISSGVASRTSFTTMSNSAQAPARGSLKSAMMVSSRISLTRNWIRHRFFISR